MNVLAHFGSGMGVVNESDSLWTLVLNLLLVALKPFVGNECGWE
jgi:hypothetical protein